MTHKAWERTLGQCGLLDEARVREAAAKPHPLQWIVDRQWAKKEEILERVATGLKIAFTTLADEQSDRELLRELGGAEKWRPRRLIPLVSMGRPARVAMSDPFDLLALDEISIKLNRPVECVLALPDDIEREYERLAPGRLPLGLKVCPQCEGDLVPIVYGLPGPELFAAADRGEVLLGGCIVSDSDPRVQCRECGCRYT